jgi:iron complex transport system ATP-binding protein
MLKAENLTYKIGEKYLVKDACISVKPGEFVVIMGRNGAGKSTLLKMLSGSMKPSSGAASLNGKDLYSIHELKLAKIRAVLSQHYDITFPITTEEIVMMGRYPHFKNAPSVRDWEILNSAFELIRIKELKERFYNTLSGGEAQKVQMSRVLAQIWEEDEEGRLLLLDEPVSSLDLRYQHELLRIARSFIKGRTAVIAVLHDINLALSYADRIILMKDSQITGELDADTMPDEKLIEDVFDIRIKVIGNPLNRKPLVIVRD